MTKNQTMPEELLLDNGLGLPREKLSPEILLSQRPFNTVALENCLNAGPCVVYLLDCRTKRYLYISKNVEDVTGYAVGMFYKHGISFSLSLYDPDDRTICVNQVAKKKLDFLNATPACEHRNYQFSCNYRIRRKDGVYIHLLQQSFVAESDSAGNPLLHFGVCSDITSYKSDNKIIFTISRNNGCGEYPTVLSECYPKCGDKVLSRREIEIVKLIMEGMNSKAIADKLFLGLHTVRTHRRNMMKKIHAKNTADVLRYAILHGII